MRTSLRGHSLPECQPDYEVLAIIGLLKYRHCIDCGSSFTSKNVQTSDGWAETQISGLCETCFDRMFNDDGEED
jgi:hypothetical protein